MNDQDYREVLRYTRSQVSNLGLRAIDERIMSNMRGSEGALWDLTFYLRHLREEIQLGSDTEYRETLRRVRRYVRTESGEPVEGIRIDLSPGDIERYGMEHQSDFLSKQRCRRSLGDVRDASWKRASFGFHAACFRGTAKEHSGLKGAWIETPFELSGISGWLAPVAPLRESAN